MAKLPLFTAPQDQASSDFRWFVYGSTLDFEALTAWCGEHGYRVPDTSTVEKAVLTGYRLAFHVRSNFWGGLVASLAPDPAGTVEGILWPLPASALGFVRHKEGVNSGLFVEQEGVARVASGEDRSCRIYYAAPSRVVAEGAPAPRFLATLIAGARTHGLSAAWIASLEALR